MLYQEVIVITFGFKTFSKDRWREEKKGGAEEREGTWELDGKKDGGKRLRKKEYAFNYFFLLLVVRAHWCFWGTRGVFDVNLMNAIRTAANKRAAASCPLMHLAAGGGLLPLPLLAAPHCSLTFSSLLFSHSPFLSLSIPFSPLLSISCHH